MIRSWLLPVALLCLAQACVSSPASLQTARTVPAGDYRVAAGVSVPVSTRYVGEIADLIGQAVDHAEEAIDGDGTITDDEYREMLQSGMAILMLQPTPIFDLSLRRGIVDDLDVGIRWAGPTWTIGGKWRFLKNDSIEMAAAFDYVYHTDLGASYAKALFDLLDFLKIASYSRHDASLNILISGNEDNIFVPYGGLRYIAGFTSVDTELEDLQTEAGLTRSETSSVIHHVGGSIGFRVGTEKYNLLMELSVLYMYFKPTVLGEPVQLSGVLITPAIGGAVEF